MNSTPRSFSFQKIIFTFLFFVSLTPLAYADLSAGPGNESFQKAMAAMAEGSSDDAEEYFKRAIDAEPMNPEYRFERASLYAQQRDESENLGDILGSDRKMQQAADDLEQAVMVKPDFLAARFNLGVVYKKLGKYEEARKEFKEVLRLDSTQASARMQIAATYEAQGFYDEAESIYKEIREDYPQSPEILDSLNGLEENRLRDSQQESQERGMRMNALSGGLSSLSQGGQMYGGNGGYQQQASGGMGQAIPYLGQWALQQFMKRKTTQQ